MTPDAAATKTPVSAPTRAAPPHVPDHELLRPIGGGSYGEVWLARNAMGTYRAVKVVYRSRFDNDRPFEREFSGIQKFEPISRTDGGLVDILQVGRNDAEGYFYYVMELADPVLGSEFPVPGSAGGRQVATLNSQLETYVPRTLRHDLVHRGRLPFEECLQLGLSLTSALAHLHKSGLVHRDVKPSNIIFVKGLPKLADIGLVTDVGDAKSFVGTEGFIPPEGPGRAQGDIYSLGKVLYEISTGKDRQAFPEPPTCLVEMPEQKELSELNEVILKACENDARKRYQSAGEMHVDLALLRGGKSVRHLRLVEKRLVQARTAGLIAVSLAVVAILAGLLFAHQAKVERESRQRIQQALNRAEVAEQAARRESYARAMLLAHEAVEDNNFGLVRELLAQTRPFAEEHRATKTVSVVPTVQTAPSQFVRYDGPDESAFVLARCDSGVSSLTVSPDGKWLAAGEANGQVLLWSVSERQLRQQWPMTNGTVTRLAFSPDSRRLGAGFSDGWVRAVEVPSGEMIAEYREESCILDMH